MVREEVGDMRHVSADDRDAAFVAAGAMEMRVEDVRPGEAELQMGADCSLTCAMRLRFAIVEAMTFGIAVARARTGPLAVATHDGPARRGNRDVSRLAHRELIHYCSTIVQVFFHILGFIKSLNSLHFSIVAEQSRGRDRQGCKRKQRDATERNARGCERSGDQARRGAACVPSAFGGDEEAHRTGRGLREVVGGG